MACQWRRKGEFGPQGLYESGGGERDKNDGEKLQKSSEGADDPGDRRKGARPSSYYLTPPARLTPRLAQPQSASTRLAPFLVRPAEV